MHAIMRLPVDEAVGPIDYLFGNFLAPMSGQAVHENSA
jgi:hypothetical protein